MMVLPTACEMILRRIREAGGEAYVVGGAVRDMLLGKIPGDHDMTTSLLPEETEELFADHTLVLAGKKHGTVGIVVDGAVYEVTTFRRDGDYHDHRRPDGVSFTRSLREDAARRDFTINAMAWSPEEGVMDFFGGREDLENGILRAVGNAEIRFEEDALRIMRGIRFAATLGFSVDDATKEAMFGKAENLRDVSGERLAVELQKLLSGKNALPILGEFRDVLAVFLGDITLPPALTGEFSADLALLFCGKTGMDAALERLKLDRNTRRESRLIHEKLLNPELFGTYGLRKLLGNGGEAPAKKTLLARMAMGYPDEGHLLDEILRRGDPVTIRDLAVNGRDLAALGITGTRMGETLDFLLEEVMRDRVANTREELLGHLKEIKS
ncbi:MAG: polynucleotide adenylyltransferase [Clostridia bacterium]|nr:polynucleotide adenylyltransferase [Clostridia bacterium]